MRLAFCLFNYFPYGGLERDCLLIAKACLARGHQIDVYTLAWEGEIPGDINVHFIMANNRTNHRRCYNFAAKLQKFLEKNKPDVTIGFNKMPGLDIYYASDLCFALKIRHKNSILRQIVPRYRLLTQLEHAVFGRESKTQIMIHHADAAVDYQRLYHTSEQRFYVLPPGITKCDLSDNAKKNIRQTLRQQYGIRDEQFLILLVGSHFESKGVDRAIKALASLPIPLKIQTQLLVIGRNKLTPYQRLARRCGVANRVIFVGARDDVLEHMLAADILIHPAYYEMAGKVLLEALSVGLPVLTTANCGYAFHITNSRGGNVIPLPFSQEQLNRQLLRLLDRDYLAVLSEQALNYAASTDLYSLAEKAAKVIETFCSKTS